MDQATHATNKHGDAVKEGTTHVMTFGDKLKTALTGITIWGIDAQSVNGFTNQIR